MTRLRLVQGLCIALWLLPDIAASAPAVGKPCLDPAVRMRHDSREQLGGSEIFRLPIPDAGSGELLVQVAEEGIDVEAWLVDGNERTQSRSDHPFMRQAVQRLVVDGPATRILMVRSVDHLAHRGTVRVVVSELPPSTSHGCARYLRDFAQADSLYAAAQQAAKAPERASTQEAGTRYAAAANAYARVASRSTNEKEAAVQGEASLAVALIQYHNLRGWDASARWAKSAAASFERVQDLYGRARARGLLAMAWLESPSEGGSLEEARAEFRSLAKFHSDRDEGYDEALQLNNLGLSYYNQARFEEALPSLKAARDKLSALGESPRKGLAIQNIALCEWGLGRMAPAMQHFNEALALMPEDWRPGLYLNTLHNSGLINQSAGNFDESLRMHNRALRMATRTSNAYWEARSLLGLGLTYYSIGKRSLSRHFLQQALERMTPELDERGRVTVLRALAVLDQEEHNFDSADLRNMEALRLSRSSAGRDRIWLRFAETALARGDLEVAEQNLVAVTVPLSAADRLTMASARLLRAKLARQRGDTTGALRDLDAALPVFKSSQALVEEFETQVETARVHAAAGGFDRALASINAALDLGDELRTQTSNLEYRASVAASIRPAFEFKLNLLRGRYEQYVKQGHAAEATRAAKESLALADTARARAFEQYLDLRLDPARDAQLADRLAEREQLYRDLADRRFYLATRVDRAGPTDARARALREEIAALRARLGELDSQIDSRGSLRIPKKKTLDPETLLQPFDSSASLAAIEYWIGSDTAYAWVIRQGKVVWVKLQDAPGISRAARRLHDALLDFTHVSRSERLEAASQLNSLVYEPLASSLSGVTQLTIVPDGPLHFVPFAALRDRNPGSRYLVQRASIALTPALRFAPKSGSGKVLPPGRLLLVSDPVYQPDDARIRVAQSRDERSIGELARLRDDENLGDLQRLPATANEAAAIRKWFAVTQIDELSGLGATRARLLDRDLDRYQYIHVAAHGTLDGEIPQLSALTLGAFGERGRVEDQQVRVGDLLARSFSARVVVLSACNTSLGPDYPEEGPLGLRYAVLARGARAVVSSLWPVMDETNARLMTELYGRMLGSGERVDHALAGAMRVLLGKSPEMDPAQWAPFTAYLAER